MKSEFDSGCHVTSTINATVTSKGQAVETISTAAIQNQGQMDQLQAQSEDTDEAAYEAIAETASSGAFLDNSGDIVLDADITDEGRHRLLKEDGAYKGREEQINTGKPTGHIKSESMPEKTQMDSHFAFAAPSVSYENQKDDEGERKTRIVYDAIEPE